MSNPQHTELLGLTIQQLTEIAENFGQPGYRVRQLLDGLYRQRWSRLEQFTMLPLAFRQRLSESGYAIGLPGIEKKFVSTDGTVRYLLAFSDGQSVETVWMPEGDGGEAGDGSEDGDAELQELSAAASHSRSLDSARDDKAQPGAPSFRPSGAPSFRPSLAKGWDQDVDASNKPPGRKGWQRATICVSSQVGCAVECAFCMTALLGLKRNLSAGEIVGQILAVLNDQQVEMERDRVNLVFMGQGEPFLNYDNFMQAVRLLVEGVGIPESRMTVSTSGIVPRIADFGAEPVRPKLAVSLNAPNEALRTQVMPITRKWTIEKLIAALREFPLRNRERLTFEYVLLGGVNDGVQHAREMVDLIRGLRAKVNLIALNSGPEIPFSTPSDDRVLAFQSVLTRAGIPAFVRRPRGRDIYAACGQLKHTTELVQVET
ncbi:MAG TPA: 23S rRNA (adenine(2503)-C(2))-methyltransferase RlmN [Terriglobales bacterium]|jgi:23S rRNA (adenine2503-C2)-methyltransferase